MKKKGFTLIELLAVIVVLAIIALIAVPIVLNIIEQAKKNSFKNTVYGVIHAADLFMVSENIGKNDILEFTCDGTSCHLTDGRSLSLKGQIPTLGKLIIKDGIAEASYLQGNSYCALGTRENLDIQKDCTKLDITEAELILETSKVSSNSILVRVRTTDNESGIKNIEYLINDKSKSSEDKKSVQTVDETYLFEDLDKNTEYQIKVKVTNGNNKETEKTINTTTEEIENPGITYTNTPTTAADGYLEKQVINVTFNNSNITTPSYYIKTTRRGTSNINVTSSCGTSTEPGTCTSITSTDILNTNTWYKVTENVNVSYSEASDIAGTLYAITYDGRNYSGASTGLISKIDPVGPVISLKGTATKTDSLIVSYSITDKVGIKSTTCKYGETSGSYTKTASATSTSCTMTNLDDDKTYYYQICSTDNLGIKGNCVTGNSKTNLVNNPSITYTNTPTEAVNGYLEKQVINVTFNNSNITTPSYYVKTTRKGTSNINVTSSCGTSTEPESCTNITSTNILNTNTWYKITGNVKIAYNETNDTNDTLYALTYDGNNYSGASTGMISKIDNENPILENINVTEKTNSMIITYDTSDTKSGLDVATCSYGTELGKYNRNQEKVTVTTTSCTIASLNQNSTYYYKICITDKVGNETCKEGSSNTLLIQNPIVTYTNTGSGEILTKQIVNINYKTEGVENPNNYVKTTRKGKLTTGEIIATCDIDTDNPSNCTSSNNITTLIPNTWYKVKGSVSITYEEGNANTDNIYAITYDGVNYSGASVGTISKIYYKSEEIKYTNNNITNTKEALDYLYNNLK